MLVGRKSTLGFIMVVNGYIGYLPNTIFQAINLSYDRYTVYSPVGSNLVGDHEDSYCRDGSHVK